MRMHVALHLKVPWRRPRIGRGEPCSQHIWQCAYEERVQCLLLQQQLLRANGSKEANVVQREALCMKQQQCSLLHAKGNACHKKNGIRHLALDRVRVKQAYALNQRCHGLEQPGAIMDHLVQQEAIACCCRSVWLRTWDVAWSRVERVVRKGSRLKERALDEHTEPIILQRVDMTHVREELEDERDAQVRHCEVRQQELDVGLREESRELWQVA